MKRTASPHLVLDYETRSEADLRAVGGYEYARHPTTEILCVAWRYAPTKEGLRTAKTRSWSPALDYYAPADLIAPLSGPRAHLVAHNALFEQMITRYVLPKYVREGPLNVETIPITRWLCTASLAAAVALPRKLEGACAALNLPHQKDMAGHKLMLKMSKPRKATKYNAAKWYCKKADLLRLMEYCEHDIDAEVDLLLTLPDLTANERRVWELDQRTNLRGFAVDRPVVEKVIGFIDTELARYEREIKHLTGGAVSTANKVASVKSFVNGLGAGIENVQAKTVQDALKRVDLDPTARRVLEIRASASKTSTGKYYSIEARSRVDSRVRDIMMYHGASTGRWTGLGVQIQNFPRGTLSDAQSRPVNSVKAVDLLANPAVDLEAVRLLYGDPMEFFSHILRSTIKATPGYEMFCGDYAAIEVRVLFWLANHADGIKAYRDGRKIYEEMAQVVYAVRELDAVTKAQREIGKRIILGCGYSMGAKKFMETCEHFGVAIDPPLAEKAVKAYRTFHAPVVKFWYALEDAAIRATLDPGKRYRVGSLVWVKEGEFLWCILPSSRRLAFYGPQVERELTPWKEFRPKLYHWDILPASKRWVFQSTYPGRLAENVTQAVARDVMAAASLRVDDAGYPMLFSVHDELGNEREIGRGSLAEYTRLMSEPPEWAGNMPIKVETWKGERYRK